MRKKLFSAALLTGMAATLVAAPSADAATKRLKCVTYKLTFNKVAERKTIKVHNGCAGRVKVDAQVAGKDSGYKLIAHGANHNYSYPLGLNLYGLKIYYKGKRYYNRIGRDMPAD
jgi:hypothetical protein